jgi:hypothetical protein
MKPMRGVTEIHHAMDSLKLQPGFKKGTEPDEIFASKLISGKLF